MGIVKTDKSLHTRIIYTMYFGKYQITIWPSGLKNQAHPSKTPPSFDRDASVHSLSFWVTGLLISVEKTKHIF